MSKPKRLFVKVTFSLRDPIDAELWGALQLSDNRAGTLKKMAYDFIKVNQRPSAQPPIQEPAVLAAGPERGNQQVDPLIKKKLDKLEEF